jgi:tetratricopeptide (TPR) repeat protein
MNTILLFSLFNATIACRSRTAAVVAPGIDRPDPKVQEMIARADLLLSGSHLHAWRSAEDLYRTAFQSDKSEGLRDKLLTTRFLIEARQADEDIPDRGPGPTLGSLCGEPLSSRQKLLCELGPRYVAGMAVPAPADLSVLNAAQSPVDAYIHTLAARSYEVRENKEDIDARYAKYKDSPLFIYLELGKEVRQRQAELERSLPEFAELFTFLGYASFQSRKYAAARGYFRKAIERLPDYTRAHIGLGNISVFALEDYDNGLVQYENALRFDGGNSAALFGKGLVLHNLGRYRESNDAMDLVLRSDLSRHGRAGVQSVGYYRGEATFYQAYNHHHLKDASKARELVDAAKKILPNSDSVNYLSGLMYYQEKKLHEAKDDFVRVLQSGQPNCDAQHYLGLIHWGWRDAPVEKTEFRAPQVMDKDPKARDALERYVKQFDERFTESNEILSLNYFLGACSCMDASVRSARERIGAIPTLEIEEAEKVVLTGRLQKKLFSYRSSAIPLIEGMIRMSGESQLPHAKDYVALMTDILDRVRPETQ